MSEIREEELEIGVSSGVAGERDNIYAEPVRGAAAFKGLYSKGNKKRLYIYVGVAIFFVVALIYTFTRVENPTPLGGDGVVDSGQVSSRVASRRTITDREEAARYNAEQLEVEQEKNPYAHPVITTDLDDNYEGDDYSPFVESSNLKTPTKLSQAGSTENGSSAGQGQQQRQESYDEDAYRSADELISRLVASETATPVTQIVSWAYAAPKKKIVEVGETGEAGGMGGSTSKSCAIVLARAGSMAMATTNLALNSDVGGPVSLTIRNGKLRGSKLIGGFERKDKWLRLELNKLVTPKDTIPISAIGLDLDTTLNAVSGKVDSHLMYRYGWWGFGTVLSAVGKASASNSNNTAFISDGVITQSTTKDTSRELKMALGSLGEDIGEIMRDRINRPITVSLKVDDEVGVFFVDDVCLESAN